MKKKLFKAFIKQLDIESIPYCILSMHESYPEQIPSDVDFMVMPNHIIRLPSIIQRVAEQTGSLFVQTLQHETSAFYFVLAKQESSHFVFLQPDSISDYRRNGRVWLSAERILMRRRLCHKGFFVPAPDDAFIYYLMKKIDKGSISENQGQYLINLFNKAPEKCLKQMLSLWPKNSVRLFETALKSNNWEIVCSQIPRLAKELHQSAPLENLPNRIMQWIHEIGRKINRVLFPTGLLIAFLGPDGCGKSSLIDKVVPDIALAFRRAKIFHLRPRLVTKTADNNDPVKEPHGQPERNWLISIVKLLYLFFDFNIGFILKVRPMLVRSTLVVFDRYYHDLIVDPKRQRYGGPIQLVLLISRLIIEPDIWIFLDAQAEVLQSRKREVSFDESSRQRRAYLTMAKGLSNSFVVDTERPFDKVVSEVERIIMEYMAERTSRQFGFQNK
ncbi:MAG: thymidylate kinase-like protein [Deltaproteobacteria bacterium]|nr:thymidylate kinase-like protein [Deltaproteobacteria bacterium]